MKKNNQIINTKKYQKIDESVIPIITKSDIVVLKDIIQQNEDKVKEITLDVANLITLKNNGNIDENEYSYKLRKGYFVKTILEIENNNLKRIISLYIKRNGGDENEFLEKE